MHNKAQYFFITTELKTRKLLIRPMENTEITWDFIQTEIWFELDQLRCWWLKNSWQIKSSW